jgi:succinoglycan biosynthesis protein ExoW
MDCRILYAEHSVQAQQVPRTPHRLAIIIPYYQRQAGILRRCLASIFAQKLNSLIEIQVVVVDDASPWSAKEELRDLQIPEQMRVDVITRENGGPGAARNSGLDHASRGADFIAFIDSDDTWKADHVQRAVDALGGSHDLYFADYLQWEGLRNFDTRKFGVFMRMGRSSSRQPLATVKDVWLCSNIDIIPYAVKESVAHTSSIVYRTSAFSTCQFDEELWYGEDDLFVLDLLFSSVQSCISTNVEVELGLGENIFFDSWSWDSENNVRRCYYQFLTYKKIQRRYPLSFELNEEVVRIIRTWRPVLTFFIMRQLLKGRGVSPSLLLSLVREDPLFVAAFPLNVVRAAGQWAVGKLRGIPAFHQK